MAQLRSRSLMSLLALLCLIIAGCSSTQLFYNQADWLLHYRANHYFNLDSSQKTVAKQQIATWLAWHRQSQLTCYAELIGQFKIRAGNDLTVADVAWLENKFLAHYANLVTSALQPASLVLTGLDTEQVNHLENRLSKDQKKLAKELNRGKTRRLENRAEKTVESVEKWFGSLSREQVDWIKTQSLALPDLYEPWLNYRNRRDQTTLTLLRAGADASTLARSIESLWSDPGQAMTTSSESEQLLAKMQTQSHLMAVEFYRLASTGQKAHFWRRLDSYRQDFLQLASSQPDASCEVSTVRQASSTDTPNNDQGA